MLALLGSRQFQRHRPQLLSPPLGLRGPLLKCLVDPPELSLALVERLLGVNASGDVDVREDGATLATSQGRGIKEKPAILRWRGTRVLQ
jgi:hypothetical protein